MKWWEFRGMNDAPVHYGADEANAWADGYNSAVAAYEKELKENMAKEKGE